MKRNIKWTGLFLATALVFTACGKKDEAAPPPPPAPTPTPVPQPTPPIMPASGGYDNSKGAGQIIAGQAIQDRVLVMSNFHELRRDMYSGVQTPPPSGSTSTPAPAAQNALANIPLSDRTFLKYSGWSGFPSEQALIMFFFDRSGNLSFAANLRGEIFRGYNIPYEYNPSTGRVVIASVTATNQTSNKSTVGGSIRIEPRRLRDAERIRVGYHSVPGFSAHVFDTVAEQRGNPPHASSPTSIFDIRDFLVLEVSSETYQQPAQGQPYYGMTMSWSNGLRLSIGDTAILKTAAPLLPK